MRLFIVLGGLLIALLLALLVGPRFVDWTSYRSAFETEASRILGRPVSVQGRATATLLPFPSIAFTDVLVGDAREPDLRIGAFRMDAELAPFLSGEIHIFHTQVTRPEVRVTIAQDGSIRWPLDLAALSKGSSVVLEKVEIRDGSARLMDRRLNRDFVVSDLQAELSARSLRGPFNGAGTLRFDGSPVRVSLSTGVVSGDGTLPLRLTTESDEIDLALSLAAVASSQPGAPLLDGTVSLQTPLPKAASEPAPVRPSLLPPIGLESRLVLTSRSVVLEEIRASIGGGEEPYLATGSARLDVAPIPHFDLELSGQDIDIDALAPPPSDGAISVSQRLEDVRRTLSRIPASPIPGRVRLTLPLLTIGDTPVRDVQFAGSPSQNGWSIERFSGELPGRTLVEASGLADLSDSPGFDGTLLVAARQPSAFFRWAGVGNDATLAGLDRAGLSASVQIDARSQVLRDLEINLGGQTLRGSVSRSIQPEATATVVDLRGEAIDAEPFRALAETASSFRTSDERLDVQFAAHPFRYRSVAADTLETDFTLAGGVLDISTLDAKGLAGTDLHMEGTVSGIGTVPKPDVSLQLTSEQPERFAAFLKSQWPENPLVRAFDTRSGALGPISLQGTVETLNPNADASLVAAFEGKAGGTDLNVRLALENGLAAATENGRFGLDATFGNTDPIVLLQQVGLPVLPTGVPGPLHLTLTSSGSPNEATTLSLEARAPGSNASANGTVVFGPSGLRSVDTRLTTRSDDLSPWLTTLGIAAGQGLDALPAEADGRFRWQDGDWAVDGLAGKFDGIGIEARLQTTVGSPVSGSLKTEAISFPWVTTLLTGLDDPFEGDPTRTFGSPLLPSRGFELTLEADRVDGLGELTDLRATLTATQNELRLSTMSGRVSDGQFAGDGSFRNVEGLVGTHWDLRFSDIALQSASPLIRGSIGGELTLRSGGQSFAALRQSLEGAGRVSLSDGRLPGIAAAPMNEVRERVNQDGFVVDEDSVERLVAHSTQGATLELPTVEVDLRIANGTARFGPFEITTPQTTLDGTIEVALANGAITGSLVQVLPRLPSDETEGVEDPSVTYRAAGSSNDLHWETDPAVLTTYLATRAYQIEQRRVEALEEALRETVRLRRETRFYRERMDTRETFRAERIEAEEKARQAEEERRAALRAAAEQAAREEAEAREAAERRQREAEAAAAQRPTPSLPSTTQDVSPLDLETPVPSPAPPTPPVDGFSGLPGVQDPNQF